MIFGHIMKRKKLENCVTMSTLDGGRGKERHTYKYFGGFAKMHTGNQNKNSDLI